MTKAELVEAVAKSASLTKAAAEKAVGAFISTVSGALKKGDRVTLVGFGSFEVASRKARTGRNPQTGKEIKIAAAKVPKFRPGKALKDAVASYERDLIIDALKTTRGNRAKAARLLDTTERILIYKVRGYGIDVRRFKTPEVSRRSSSELSSRDAVREAPLAAS